MGCGPFKSSRSSYEEDRPMMAGGFAVSMNQPNPDPSNYEIQRVKTIRLYLIVKIKYLDCTNYEGMKILVYKGCTIDQLEQQKTIDPHFCENPKYYSPIARFEPTEQGWIHAEVFCNALHEHYNLHP